MSLNVTSALHRIPFWSATESGKETDHAYTYTHMLTQAHTHTHTHRELEQRVFITYYFVLCESSGKTWRVIFQTFTPLSWPTSSSFREKQSPIPQPPGTHPGSHLRPNYGCDQATLALQWHYAVLSFSPPCLSVSSVSLQTRQPLCPKSLSFSLSLSEDETEWALTHDSAWSFLRSTLLSRYTPYIPVTKHISMIWVCYLCFECLSKWKWLHANECISGRLGVPWKSISTEIALEHRTW